MGNNNSSSTNTLAIKKNKISKGFDRFDYHSNIKIAENISCPVCSREFNGLTSFKEFNIHLKQCGLEYCRTNKPCEIYAPKDDKLLNDLI